MDIGAELGVPVEGQEPGSRVTWERFPELLGDPSGGRVRGHSDADQVAACVPDHEEDVERLEVEGRGRQEVARGDSLTMIPEERHPLLHLVGVRRAVRDVTRDGSLRHVEAEFEHLTVNPGCSPGRVLASHPANQTPNLSFNLGPPGSSEL